MKNKIKPKSTKERHHLKLGNQYIQLILLLAAPQLKSCYVTSIVVLHTESLNQISPEFSTNHLMNYYQKIPMHILDCIQSITK